MTDLTHPITELNHLFFAKETLSYADGRNSRLSLVFLHLMWYDVRDEHTCLQIPFLPYTSARESPATDNGLCTLGL